MPGNPDLRFRTCNLRTETMIFCFFLLSGIFLQPLIKNGFWTQYNRFFGTPKHLASEFRKSDDALLVKYIVKRGTEEMTGLGFCIEASDNKIILLENNQFRIYSQPEYAIREVIPEHTGKALQFKTIHFIDITADSLNKLVQNHPLKSIDFQSNNHFWIHHDFTRTKKRQFKTNYPNELWIEAIKTNLVKEPFTSYTNPKIKTLQFQIENLRQNDEHALKTYTNNQNELRKLESKFEKETHLFTKEQLLKKIQQLKKIQAPELNTEKISFIRIKIDELQRSDQIKNVTLQKNLKEKYLESLPGTTKFSGLIVKIIIASTYTE